MKKLLLITILAAFTISKATSQIIQKSVPPVKKNVIIKTVPSQPPPPPVVPPPTSTNKTPVADNQNPPVYTLTSVKVSLQTGNDNKEFPAMLGLTLYQKNPLKGIYGLLGNGIKNELPVNSVTDFGLESSGYAPTVDNLKLETLQQTGLMLNIYYGPTFFLDAWKIEGVKLTLEFKDQNGNLHPVFGTKTIVFNTAKGILNNTFHTMKCYADGTFTPLTSPISEY